MGYFIFTSHISEQAFYGESDEANGVRVCCGRAGEDGTTAAARPRLTE